MQINITETHIKNGERKDPNHCPVALAIREQIKNSTCVEVCDSLSPFAISFLTENDFIEADASDVVLEFVENFDNRRKVEPFSFNLSIPTEEKK